MADLLTLVRQDVTSKRVASTNGGEYAGPCPFCGGTDRFRCWPDHPDGGGGHWWCRQCNHGGDLIAYRVERGDITPQEAGRLRHDGGDQPHRIPGGRDSRTVTGRRHITAPVRRTGDAPPITWQEKARVFCNYCQQMLFESDNEGLAHLRGRGLTDDTIRQWRLGWHEKTRRSAPQKWGLDGGKSIYLPRGVVIPQTACSQVCHIKVRLFETWKSGNAPKYIGVRGGRPTLFGLDHMEGKAVIVVCEGELDAVLLDQEAGDLVDVVALGSKSAKVAPESLVHLLSASRWLLALDNDAEAEAEAWSRYSGRVHRAQPLEGNDLTDFHNAGGDLRAWVSYHLDHMGVEVAFTRVDSQPVIGSAAVDKRMSSVEQRAEELLARCDNSPAWAHEWAELATEAGWPCFNLTWQAWVDAVNASALD